MQCAVTVIAAIAAIREIVERRDRAADVRRQQHSPILEAQFDQRSIIQRDAERVASCRRGLS